MFCDVLFLLQMPGFTDSILARASKFYGLKERGQRSCYWAVRSESTISHRVISECDLFGLCNFHLVQPSISLETGPSVKSGAGAAGKGRCGARQELGDGGPGSFGVGSSVAGGVQLLLCAPCLLASLPDPAFSTPSMGHVLKDLGDLG